MGTMKISSVKVSKLAIYFISLIWSVVTVYPLFIALISSVKSNEEIFGSMFSLPRVFYFEFYLEAIETAMMHTAILNSLFLATTTTFFMIITSSMVSFVLARQKYKFLQVIYLLFIVGVMLPIHATIIPLAKIVSDINGINNYFVLTLIYIAFQLPMSVFLITGFMKGIPKDLDEAAIIDGCSMFGVLYRIYIPLSAPAIATSAILAFLQVYNELLFAVMFLNDRTRHTVSVGLLHFVGHRTVRMGPVFASIILAIAPMLIIYIIFNKQIQKGMLEGAIKG